MAIEDEVHVLLQLTLFAATLWAGGRLLQQLHMSPALAWIVVMVLLGPQAADIVPYASPPEGADDADGVAGLSLLGQVGVTLHLFDKGLHVHGDKVLRAERSAVLVSLVVSLLPVAVGVGVAAALGFDGRESVALGCAMGPTSVSAAVALLAESGQLLSSTGRLLLASVFINDSLSLLGLSVAVSLSTSDLEPLDVALPAVVWALFMAFGVGVGRFVLPKTLPRLLTRMPEDPARSHQPGDEVHLALMVGTLALMVWVGDTLPSSHLVGAYVAGCLFADVPRSGLVWRRQLKRLQGWFKRFFFAASVGLLLDKDAFFDGETFAKGVVLALTAGVAAKLLGVLPLRTNRWLVGSAMVARGPLAFVVVQEAALEQGVLGEEAYAAAVWALLLCSLVAPLAMRVLSRRNFEKSFSTSGIRKFALSVQGHHHTGILHEVCDCLHEQGLDVVGAKVDTDGEVDVELFTVQTRHGDLSEAQVEDIRESLMEAVNDPEAQIILQPLDDEEEESGMAGANNVVEVRLMGGHHPAILHELYETLDAFDLEVVKAKMEEHTHGVDADIFYAKPRAGVNPTAKERKRMREQLHDVFKKHQLHGEVMVKLVKEDNAKVDHVKSPLQQRRSFLDPSFGVDLLEVRIDTSHDQHLLEDVCTALSNMQLDVISAEMEQTADARDRGVFFAKDNAMMQRSMELRKSLMDPSKWGEALEQRQQSIQEVLDRLVQKHQAEGQVVVAQLREGVSSRARTASAPALLDKQLELREFKAHAQKQGSLPNLEEAGCESDEEDVVEIDDASEALEDVDVVRARRRASSTDAARQQREISEEEAHRRASAFVRATEVSDASITGSSFSSAEVIDVAGACVLADDGEPEEKAEEGDAAAALPTREDLNRPGPVVPHPDRITRAAVSSPDMEVKPLS